MGELAIRVSDLSKRYKIGARVERYRTLRDALSRAVTEPWRRLRSVLRGERAGASEAEIWALKDVSLEVERGEVLGIIGRNGAGKSTLLKILSQITPPTKGWAQVRGRVSSLLEVGTGFHPELTGRENIYLNGAILGMKRKEIQRKFDEIVDFAGVEKFIETPVKYFSSGMYVRLAFAVAAHLEPDVMLVDEVLAVGDSSFQEKCLGKLGGVTQQGRTVLFVSHNMGAIRQLCPSCVLLDEGRIRAMGPTSEVLSEYMAISHTGQLDRGLQRNDPSRGRVQAVGFAAQATDGGMPRTGAPADFLIEYYSQDQQVVPRLNLGLAVRDSFGATVFVCSSWMKRAELAQLPPSGSVCCHVQWLPLVPGRYWVDLKLIDSDGSMDFLRNAASFMVTDAGEGGFFDFANRQTDGNIVVPHEWEAQDEESKVGRGRLPAGISVGKK